MRAPVDLHLAVIEPVAPFAQTRRRKMQRGGILAHAHSAPVHRLHMHRPERLEGTRARVRAHRIAPSLTPFALLFSLLTALFPAQFQQVFRMLVGFFLADEMLHPAIERVLRQPVLTAIFRPAQCPSAPRLDVQRPVRAVRVFPGTSMSHRRSSSARRNPISPPVAPPNRCAAPIRLHPTDAMAR